MNLRCLVRGHKWSKWLNRYSNDYLVEDRMVTSSRQCLRCPLNERHIRTQLEFNELVSKDGGSRYVWTKRIAWAVLFMSALVALIVTLRALATVRYVF